jgi:membrane-bound lytic murein transglycosylase B
MGGKETTAAATTLPIFITLLALLLAGDVMGQCCADKDISSRREALWDKLRTNGFGDEELQRIFSDERVALYPEILEKKGKGLNYFNRTFGLLTRQSIERGRKMLTEHRALLKGIEDKYGVEKEVLIAVFRVETNFGRYTGSFPVFNSLLTMSLLENRRSAWAEQELINLLVLSRANNTDPLTIKGSWAGAFGLCQFIPSSYLKYGADGNGDGLVNLFEFADAMASVANYLKSHGWEKGHPAKMKEALWAYNHCDNYIEAVLTYARATKKNGPRKSSTRS